MSRPRKRTSAIVTAATAACALAAAAGAFTPTDPEATHPAYAALGLPAAWELTTGSPNVTVAIVDSGIDASHPDLAGAVLPGYDFVDEDADASDPPGSGHGTAVTGVVAARANNGIGGVGACFSCTVMPLRVLGPSGIAFNTNTAEAIDHAVDHGAAVVNVSLYGERSPRQLLGAVARARAAGVLVVAAAGNEANATPQYPAAFPEAISVASATSSGTLASFSSRGPWVKFAAPECAPITLLGGGQGVGCATSVSTPLVSGVIALLRAQAPFASAADIENALARTARPVAGTQFGLVDAAAALRSLRSPEPRLQPTVLGDAVAGRELEAFAGIWAGSGIAATYRWERCLDGVCAPIPDASSARYTATAADSGRRLRVVVAAAGVESAASAQTSPVEARPQFETLPSIVGRPRVGTRMVALPGRWQGANLRFEVFWQRCQTGCVRVAHGRSYRVRPRDRGSSLRIEVIASNSVGTVRAVSKVTRVVK